MTWQPGFVSFLQCYASPTNLFPNKIFLQFICSVNILFFKNEGICVAVLMYWTAIEQVLCGFYDLFFYMDNGYINRLLWLNQKSCSHGCCANISISIEFTYTCSNHDRRAERSLVLCTKCASFIMMIIRDKCGSGVQYEWQEETEVLGKQRTPKDALSSINATWSNLEWTQASTVRNQ